MNKGLLAKILICVVSFSAALCAYLDARNSVTKLMIDLPKISKNLTLIREQNTILQYTVEKFENPSYLLDLLKQTEYANLLHQQPLETIAIETKDQKEIKKEVKGYSSKALLGTKLK
ncbi:MAG: hypothetical protein S4CHLAM20_04910 [Chlamydiia bacterium]|nr:hypothetical protein [Chlamydiia bacterium]